MDIAELKRLAGCYAADQVESGMVVGLGSGSTSRFATLHIAERLRKGSLTDIVGIPTSNETGELARAQGIPLTDLEAHARIDLTIDGADEVDPELNVIKGLGGFLLREKVVAYASDREIIVVDDRKISPRLGIVSPVPVEVLRFGWERTLEAVQETGTRPVVRLREGLPYVTDEGNYILDCYYDAPIDIATCGRDLNAIPGVVENGLFVGMVTEVVVASAEGVRTIALPNSTD